jgi:hypothetical protein
MENFALKIKKSVTVAWLSVSAFLIVIKAIITVAWIRVALTSELGTLKRQ